ncbi:MAG: glycogen/starch synthase [Bacteroidetes bacterium]|nr:glycogen/starch synthase [Bacteroidota bacterium]
MSLKILYVTHEMDPYASLTDISKMARQLPEHMQDEGMEVRVFMPRYGKINERKHRLHEVIRLSGINIPVADEDNPMIIKVASLPIAKIQIYFLDNEDFFHRKAYLHDENQEFFSDNDHRTLFFNKGVIEIATKLGWEPDIIHIMGWMGNLIPYYARTQYKNEPVFKNAKIVFNTYGNDFTNPIGEKYAQNGHIDSEMPDFLNLNNPNCQDLYKIGVTYADAVINSSNGNMQELTDYIKTLEKPVLHCAFTEENESEYIESTKNFYKEILQ